MKRLNIILLALIAALLVMSRGRAVSMTDKSLVHAAAIDSTPDGVMLTLQIFAPEAAGADTPIDISKANFKTLRACGSDISQCLSKLSALAGKELFLGHLQLIVISRDMSFSDPCRLLSPFIDDKSICPRVLIAAADDAQKIVSFPIKENAVTSENYKSLSDVAASRGLIPAAHLDDIGRLADKGAAALPYCRIAENGSDKRLEFSGAAVMTMAGFENELLSDEKCRLLSLISGGGDMPAQPPEFDIKEKIFGLKNIRRDYSFTQKGGRLAVSITVRADSCVTDTATQQELSARLTELLARELEKGHDLTGIYRQARFWCPFFYAKTGSLKDIADIDVKVRLYKEK